MCSATRQPVSLHIDEAIFQGLFTWILVRICRVPLELEQVVTHSPLWTFSGGGRQVGGSRQFGGDRLRRWTRRDGSPMLVVVALVRSSIRLRA
jgi:hypothetical protein